MSLQVSVVVATFNRKALLLSLLRDLGAQTQMPKGSFEVIVVDDGSQDPVKREAIALEVPYRLQVIEQENAGQAAARHRGLELAKGDIIVIVDDDMTLPPDFLRAHIRAHERGLDVVMGAIKPAPDASSMPVFERWHARQLVRWADVISSGKATLRGADLATGNVSFKRALYFDVGGFDRALKRSEDRELGIRFEKAGAKLGMSSEAFTINGTDHTRLDVWLERSHLYGIYDSRIAKKHPEMENADPWKFIFLVSPLSRPLLLVSMAVPAVGDVVGKLAMQAAVAADRAGLEKLAFAGTTLTYGLAYFRGMREESGTMRESARTFARYAAKRGRDQLRRGQRSVSAAAAGFVDAVATDHAQMRRGRAKYLGDDGAGDSLAGDLVKKIGLQMMVAVRAMRFLRDSGIPYGGQVGSRLIRHVYGAEIHWNAEIGAGTGIIHGNGLVISHAARVGEGCVLAHNVTLGAAVDPETRENGAPSLERDVHVGPGATLLGPITVGEGSKIMAGAVLTHSVPPGSLVRPAASEVTTRKNGKREAASNAAE